MVKLHIGCAWLAASHFEIVIGIPTFSMRRSERRFLQ